MKNPIVLDIETLGTNPWNGRLLCLGVRTAQESACWPADRVPQWVWGTLADPEVPIVAHTTFDARYLILDGYHVQGPYFDTRKMAQMLDENTPLDLAFLSKLYLGQTMDKRLRRADNLLWFRLDSGVELPFEDAWNLEPQQVMDYCERDCETEGALFEHLAHQLKDKQWARIWLEEEVPYTQELVYMETAGLPIDMPAVERARVKLTEEVEEREGALLAELGYDVNFNSPDQMASVLFDKVWYQKETIEHGLDLRKPSLVRYLAESQDCSKSAIHQSSVDDLIIARVGAVTPRGFTVQKHTHKNLIGFWTRKGFGFSPTRNTKKGKRSTSTPQLMTKHADKAFVRKLIEYRKRQKIIGTYLNTYPKHTKDGRLYGRFNSAGTVSNRLSSSEPNLMNQPSQGPLGEMVRGLFVADEVHGLIVGDHSQLEPRIMAHLSHDPVLLDIYRSSKDLYIETARFIFGREVDKDAGERQICKRLMLALGYGAQAGTIAQGLCLDGHQTTEDRAQDYLTELKNLYGVFFDWKDAVISQARLDGYVKSIGGRYRRLAPAFHRTAPWKNQMRGERQAVNFLMQASAADILRSNMIDCGKLPWPLRLLAQVHDELLWDYYPRKPKDEDFEYNGRLEIMRSLRDTCQNPWYNLAVPLVFEPAEVDSWASKGQKMEGPQDDEEDIA